MEMEKGFNSWSTVMISELNHGRELAKQLQNHLDPSTPQETRVYLVEKILSTYNKALHMANLPGNPFLMDPPQINFDGGKILESPASISHCSIRSNESSDLENHRRASKKRKTLPRRVETVKVGTETGGGLEGPLNDGYNWRKYGQKDIHGAAFPRSYYRCTHRDAQGCHAKKQIQKSDEDPTVFQVIYTGHHTCTQTSQLNQPSTSRNPPPVLHQPVHPVKPEPTLHHPQQEKQEKQNHWQQIASEPAAVIVQPHLKVETADFDTAERENIFLGPFSFSSAFLDAAEGELANNWLIPISPATSDSNHLQSSPAHNAGVAGVWTPESDFNEQGASDPNSPMGRLEFTLDELGIDPNFPFDNLDIFF